MVKSVTIVSIVSVCISVVSIVSVCISVVSIISVCISVVSIISIVILVVAVIVQSAIMAITYFPSVPSVSHSGVVYWSAEMVSTSMVVAMSAVSSPAMSTPIRYIHSWSVEIVI